MAPKRNAQAAELMEAERADRAENADINEAIARTDSEVFTDAIGDEPLEDDAGTELEDMGDGLEGEELEEDQEQEPEGERQARAPGDQEDAEQAGDEEDAEADNVAPEGEGAEPPSQADQRPPPSIPPRVLAAQRERYQAQNEELRTQLRDMQMRIDNLSRQPAPQPQPQPQPQPGALAPDMFADPDGYRNWVLSEAERRADARFNDRFGQMQQQQQRDLETRLNEGLAQTAQGPRAYEFNVAYKDLTSLDKTPENAALVRRLVANPENAGQAILDWWEQTSNPDYIEYHRDQIRQAYGTPRPQRGPQRQNGQLQNRQVPRHEVRLPRSLSDAAGGGSQHANDPGMFDGAEESIFAYGARR